MRQLFGSGAFRRSTRGRRCGCSAAASSTWATCSAKAAAAGAGDRRFGGAGFSDLFGTIFSGGSARPSTRRPGQTRGRDVEAEVTLEFADAVRGVTMPITLRAPGVCDTCHGNGAQARCDAARVPGLPRQRPGHQQPGRVQPLRAVPQLPGRRHGHRREGSLPGVPRHRRRHEDPYAHDPHSGRRLRRAADPAGRPWRAGRPRRPGRRPVRADQGTRRRHLRPVRRRPHAGRADLVPGGGHRGRPAGARRSTVR